MKRLWLLLPVLFLLSCGDEEANRDRFVKMGEYVAPGEDCVIRVIKDVQNNCRYILACNGITVMSHTCDMDQLR
jgi:hypothetical protein